MPSTKVRSGAPGVADGGDAPLLVRLRRATADAHQRVERRLFPAALADRVSYAAMLRVLLALHEPIETRLSIVPGLPALGIDPAQRRKAPRLRADLTGLGLDVPPAPHLIAADAVAIGGTLPKALGAFGLPEALGAFYVLEGSTLGGRVLLEQVRVRLGDVPTSFLAGYGDDTGRYWRRTRTALVEGVRADVDPGGAAQRLVAAACATFDQLDRLLDDQDWASAGVLG